MSPVSTSASDDQLPKYTPRLPSPAAPRGSRRRPGNYCRYVFALLAFQITLCFVIALVRLGQGELDPFLLLTTVSPLKQPHRHRHSPPGAPALRAKCASLQLKPSPPPSFYVRQVSDRYESGTPNVLLRNGTLWLGGDEFVQGDVLLRKGVIQGLGTVFEDELEQNPGDDGLVIVDVGGAWITPGIVDLHSHLGVDSVPELDGASDTNSILGPIQPYLRSLDGLNTHDDAYALSLSGGVTSALVLPGSADNIGGQAFMIKLRPTKEKTPSSMVVELPGGESEVEGLRWRHMKHACGENPSNVYSSTRMDSIYRFRAAYNAASTLLRAQDDYCAKVDSGDWEAVADTEFPDDLALEALVDTLRGRVKVNVHCYEAVDFDGIVRLTNEFKFPIAAYHHAHEAYLVPDLIKKTWGGAPAVAMFATNARYKREAYRGSEFAPKILSEAGIPVVMKSDHPVLNSRFLLYEAQQAHYYGLNASLALAAVTSTSAAAAGFSHRLGSLKLGHDADVVVWDSHPLQIGATPLQVYVDGIAQLSYPATAHSSSQTSGRIDLFGNLKSSPLQVLPVQPDFELESIRVVDYDGEPPLGPAISATGQDEVLFVNVSTVWARGEDRLFDELDLAGLHGSGSVDVLVQEGKISCIGPACGTVASSGVHAVDLEGGSLAPGLTTYGSGLGLVEIVAEPSTNDGEVYDLFSGVPSVLGGDKEVLRAVDGVQFGGKNMLIAYRSGVTLAITAPVSYGFLSGLSTAIRTGAFLKSQKGSVVQRVTALHVTVGHIGRPSVSAQVGALRRLLSAAEEGSVWWDVAHGDLPLVIHADKADTIATLILLKEEIDIQYGTRVQLTLAGANEAYLLAKNLADADIGVLLVPSRPFPMDWDKRRTLPGPPLTEDTNISLLTASNVTVGLGVLEEWEPRNTRFDAIWAYREAYPKLSKRQALALVSTHPEKLLGVTDASLHDDLVAYQGGDLFDPSAKVVGVLSAQRGVTDLF